MTIGARHEQTAVPTAVDLNSQPGASAIVDGAIGIANIVFWPFPDGSPSDETGQIFSMRAKRTPLAGWSASERVLQLNKDTQSTAALRPELAVSAAGVYASGVNAKSPENE